MVIKSLVFITVHNFASIVQKLMIFFFLVKGIDEWKVLSLKNDITVKKKGQKLKMKVFFLSTLFGNNDFISQVSPILVDFKNIILQF